MPGICPICGGKLNYRDNRLRIFKEYGGDKKRLLIRRLKCKCGRLHHEIPDFLVPHKHYTNEVLENVLDDVSTPADLSSEDYPCEITMKRWKDWLSRNCDQIEGMLRTIGYKLPGFTVTLLKSRISLLTGLRESGSDWLATIHRLIYNCGLRLTP